MSTRPGGTALLGAPWTSAHDLPDTGYYERFAIFQEEVLLLLCFFSLHLMRYGVKKSAPSAVRCRFFR